MKGKRAQPGSPSHSKPLGRFIPPKDLDAHLAQTQVVPRCSLVLPRSNMRFGLMVEYGKLFPYDDQAFIKMAQAVMTPAWFIIFRPYKGYFDLGFPCEADSATAAMVPSIFNNIPFPTTQTWLPTDTTLVVQFAGLPTHLPPEVLHQELME
ncbi:hypothetical protein L0F63_006196, partial [Massospora cicadina]